jgi:hypothetical protein
MIKGIRNRRLSFSMKGKYVWIFFYITGALANFVALALTASKAKKALAALRGM